MGGVSSNHFFLLTVEVKVTKNELQCFSFGSVSSSLTMAPLFIKPTLYHKLKEQEFVN